MTSTYRTSVCWLQRPKPQHSAPQRAIWLNCAQNRELGTHNYLCSEEADRRGRNVRTHLPPPAGTFSTMEAGSQEEDQTDKKVVEGEDFCHQRPLPAQPGYSKQPPSQYGPGSWTCQADSYREGVFIFNNNKNTKKVVFSATELFQYFPEVMLSFTQILNFAVKKKLPRLSDSFVEPL